MIQLHARKLKMDFADYVREINVVPVAISYEFEPCEKAKANEQYHKANSVNILKLKAKILKVLSKDLQLIKGMYIFHLVSQLEKTVIRLSNSL